MNANDAVNSRWMDRARKALAAAILTAALWVGLTATAAHAFVWGAAGAALTTAGGEAWSRVHASARTGTSETRESLAEAIRNVDVRAKADEDCAPLALECTDAPADARAAH